METKDIIQLVLKNWYYFALSFLICGIIGIVYYKTVTPVLSVTARVTLRHDETLTGGSVGSSPVLSMLGVRSGSEKIDDEAEKISSEGYLKKVVRSLQLHTDYTQCEWLGLKKTPLYDYSPIQLSMDENLTDTLSVDLQFQLNLNKDKSVIKVKAKKKTIGTFTVASFPATIQTSYGEFTFSQSEFYDPSKLPLNLKIAVCNNDVAAQVYQKLIAAAPKKKTSDFIIIAMENKNVNFAKKILNAIIDNYNKEWDADKSLVDDKTNAFIDQRLEVASVQLVNSDSEIQQFKDQNNVTEIEADVKYYLGVSAELQSGLMEAKTRSEMADILVNFLQDPKNKYLMIPFSLSTADPSIAEVTAKYNEALVKRNEYYKSNAQSSLVKSMDEQIEAQRKNMLQSLDNVKRGLDISLNNLRKKEAEFNAKIGNIPAIEKNYVQLKRNQQVQQTIYIFLLQMREDAGVKNAALLPKLNVIDTPYANIKPVSPNKKTIAVLILFFGVAIPFLLLCGVPSYKDFRREQKLSQS